jgi:hypothetical protein
MPSQLVEENKLRYTARIIEKDTGIKQGYNK